MAFKVEFKNNDTMIMTLDAPKDVKASFMQAVETGLKRRVIKFEIDIAQNLEALQEILLQMLALQKVLAKRGERIVLISDSSLPPETETQLNAAGLELRIDQKIKTLETNLVFAELYEQAQAGNWPKLNFESVFLDLQKLIEIEKSLQKEIEFYKKRIVSLRPLISDSVDLSKLSARRDDDQKKLRRLIEENEKLQIEIDKLSRDLQSKQAEYKNLSV